MARKEKTAENTAKLGRPLKEETMEKWYHVASLYVLKGLNQSQAYMQVYGTKDASNATNLFHNSRFLAIVDRLRLSQALDDDSVKKNIEALYLQTITDPDEQIKNKLAAAAQWQKLRGLEKAHVEIRNETDELILGMLKQCEDAMAAGAELRAARGRVLHAEASAVPALPHVEIAAENEKPIE